MELYWTVGPYDLVAITEAPDDETRSAVRFGCSWLPSPGILPGGQCGNDPRRVLLLAYDRHQPATGPDAMPVEPRTVGKRVRLDVIRLGDCLHHGIEMIDELGMVERNLAQIRASSTTSRPAGSMTVAAGRSSLAIQGQTAAWLGRGVAAGFE